MNKLIDPKAFEHGLKQANRIRRLTPDAQEAVAQVQKAILGMEQTPESLANQFIQHTPPQAKSDVARVLSFAFETDQEFAKATIANIIPPVATAYCDQDIPAATQKHPIQHWWELIGVHRRNPT